MFNLIKKADFMHNSSTVLLNVDSKSEIFIWPSRQEPDWGPPNNMSIDSSKDNQCEDGLWF